MVEDKSVQQMQAAGARLLQSTPGLAEKMVAASRTNPRGAGGGRDDRDAMIADLQRQLEGEKEKNRSLQDTYGYRVATFVERETKTKNKLDALERRLNDGPGPDSDEHGQRMAVIENMHTHVVAGLETIQNNTAKIIQDQEKDLMRAFRNRLQEVAKDMEEQKSRKGADSTQLLARHKQVVKELHEAQELAATFDKQNQALLTDNQKLLEKLHTKGDDRQALVRELMHLKKEVARLKAQSKEGNNSGEASIMGGGSDQAPPEAEVTRPPRRSFSQKQIDQAKLQTSHNKAYEREMAYRDAITKLKRSLEAERRQVASLKQQQAELKQQRTELEVLLRQCLDDVKAEIIRHQSEQESSKDAPRLPGDDRPIAAMTVHELTAQDRERVLELLLSQQRVVQLLYSKTFAATKPSTPSRLGDDPAGSSSPLRTDGKEDDFSWLSDIIPTDK